MATIPKGEIDSRRINSVIKPAIVATEHRKWFDSLEPSELVVVKMSPHKHGNSFRPSNNRKASEFLDLFLKFIDAVSTPSGRTDARNGPTHYFESRFRQLNQFPESANLSEAYRRKSLIFEFNLSLQCENSNFYVSNGLAKQWLSDHRPSVKICPAKSDYCDNCADFVTKRRSRQTAISRLISCGEEEKRSQIDEIKAEITDIDREEASHRQEASNARSRYNFEVDDCRQRFSAIFDQSDIAEQDRLKEEFVLVLSADFQMSKNLPFFGESPQPGSSYYLQKLTHDLFGIVCHHDVVDNHNYVYLCDELAGGPKNSDHTITFLHSFLFDDFLQRFSWIRKVCIFLDNSRITKAQYLINWGAEVVSRGLLDKIEFSYLVVGHTKFCPDGLFARVANSFYVKDVFNIYELAEVVGLYASPRIFKSADLLSYKSKISPKYTAIQGITKLRDFVISPGERLFVRENCFEGEFTERKILKKNKDAAEDVLPTAAHSYAALGLDRPISTKKVNDLRVQYSKWVPRTRWPDFLE
eukprot:TRINITY_DN6476_c0_g1_i2.p1 TRINITY_DN6476_c0_g1~~TRINITY_DN6476_c0_g1_i2.p1  ORF type:complete len:527 (+),score=129.96 TRINITY_DN6476_c0_g1_i2:456-2036(+)